MSDTDIAWCAGFFDGEGHVGYYRSVPNPSTGRVSGGIQCNIAQSAENKEVLDFFQSVVELGRVSNRTYEMPNGKPQYRLTFGVEEVMPLLIILKPYLREKKTKDFQRALGLYMTHDHKATEEDIAKGLNRNKKKGCPECGSEWNGLVCFSCGYL
jgi:hypothetical protein